MYKQITAVLSNPISDFICGKNRNIIPNKMEVIHAQIICNAPI